jgi:simple sugar transport system ATP-binding protein
MVTLTGPAAEHDTVALSRAMIGDAAIDTPRPRLEPVSTVPAHAVRIELDALPPLRGGELIGVAAVEGNGERELLRAIAGLSPHREALRVHGSVVLVPEDRTHEALIPGFSLAANLLLGNLDRAPALLDWRRITADTDALRERYDVRAGASDDPADALSGGNQQKFILGRALERRPDVLVVEHPTRGLDVHATRSIHAALREAVAQGGCVVLHSSDLDEVLALSDRLLVLHRGRVRELPINASRDVVGDAMLGVA